jgi:hypothetical protein
MRLAFPIERQLVRTCRSDPPASEMRAIETGRSPNFDPNSSARRGNQNCDAQLARQLHAAFSVAEPDALRRLRASRSSSIAKNPGKAGCLSRAARTATEACSSSHSRRNSGRRCETIRLPIPGTAASCPILGSEAAALIAHSRGCPAAAAQVLLPSAGSRSDRLQVLAETALTSPQSPAWARRGLWPECRTARFREG